MIGEKAPDWSATTYENGSRGKLSSADLTGSWYVLYWWPFDFTGICNSEVHGFEALHSAFQELGVRLVGASCDSFHSHRTWFQSADFNDSNRPTHSIVADNTHAVTKAFGFYNEAVGCAYRAAVLVSPEGEIKSLTVNHLPVAREPEDILTTARAFVKGGGCKLTDRRSL